MDSSNEKPEYPRRLYPPGFKPKMEHCMNHNCKFGKLGKLREYLGDEVWESLKQSTVRVILEFAEEKFNFSSMTVHHFIVNQLAIKKKHEIWSLIGDKPARFSLNEFASITGLNCSPFDKEDKVDVQHNAFWEELGLKEKLGVGPCWEELEEALSGCGTWTFNKKRMLGLLGVLSIGIYGISPTSRIPLETAKLVLDFDAFERYPWGRVACDSLINGIKILSFDNKSYTVKGFVYVLQIWAYESVDVLGEKFGEARYGVDVVPMLRWKGSRKRFKYSDILEEEMKIHGEVRCVNMFMEPGVDIYPQWDDDEKDPKVVNLIEDILHNRYSPSFYGDVAPKQIRKRKTVDLNPLCKKNKYAVEEGNSRDEKQSPLPEEGVPNVEEKVNCSKENTNLSELMKGEFSQMLVEFGETLVTSMQKTIAITVSGLKESIQASNASQVVRVENVEKRLEEMEQKWDSLAEQLNKGFKVNENDESVPVKDDKKAESSSKTPFWLVNKVETSESEFPIVRAVKKEQNVTTKKAKVVANTEVTSNLTEELKKKGVKASQKGTITRFKQLKKNVDVTIDVEKKADDVLMSESEGFSNTLEPKVEPKVESKAKPKGKHKGKSNGKPKATPKALLGFVDALLAKLGTDEADDRIQGKRRVQIAKTQLDPYIGNSTVKRLIPEGVIDSLSLVEEENLKKLLYFVKENESSPVGKNRGVKYLRLMTPKKIWPKKEPNYGWLHDGHMEDIMRMFTLRSISAYTPYRSTRIAFLDPVFVKKWASDLKQFELGPKNFNFSSNGYERAFDGTYDDEAQTHLEWYTDIDHLYLTHHIITGHWAALDINLKEERIDVYDSIISLTSNQQVSQSCRPFAKMLPYLLNQLVPETTRRKKNTMFEVKRMRDIPQNEDVGDCGVYAVKYIERLALGETFEGLCDANMPAFRIQLACETFNELPSPKACSSFEIPSLIDEDLELLGEFN